MSQYNIINSKKNSLKNKKENKILLNIQPFLMLIPEQLLIILILTIPIFYSIISSFFSYSWTVPKEFIGLDNYFRMFSDPWFWRSVINTIIFVNITVYLEIIVSLGIALLFVKDFPLKGVLISIVLSPYAISTVVIVLIWRFLLEPDFGIINYFLSSLGFEQILYPSNTLHAFGLMIFLSLWKNMPFTFILLYSAILAIPPEIPEAASLDGANDIQLFKYITWPMIRNVVMVALIFRFIFAFRTFDIPWILTGGGPLRSTELLSIYLYKYGFRYNELGYASAVAVIMIIMTFLISIYYIKISSSKE